jgi:spermidine/putrescine transport system ATP-binding protein
LDEPFGALDVHLRKELAKQLSELHRSMGMTFVMVTHDHSEALGLGSRIAVLNRGKIEQIGLADDIRLRPSTEFVSRFVGNRNVLDGSVLHKDGATIRVLTPLGEFTGQVAPWTKTAIEVGQRVVYVIDAADVRLGEVDVNQIVGVVHGSSFIGSLEVVQIAVESFGIFLCEVYRRERAAGASVSQAVRATWSASAAFILPVA